MAGIDDEEHYREMMAEELRNERLERALIRDLNTAAGFDVLRAAQLGNDPTALCRAGDHQRCAGWHTAEDPYGSCTCACHKKLTPPA